MNKKLISMAVGAAMTAGTVVAQAAEGDAMPKVYGKLHVSYGAIKQDDTNAGGTTTTSVDNIQFKSHASRLGVKGSVPVNDTLKAVYKIEYGIDIGDEGGTTSLSNRNQYVGLKGNFGETRFGRHDTPTKSAQGKFDEFNDTYGDFASIVQGDQRLDSVLAYLSPDFGGFNFAAAIAPGEGDGTQNNKGDGPADTISLAGQLKMAGLFVSLGYDAYDKKQNYAWKSLARLVATYGNKMFQVGGVYEQAKENADAGNASGGDKTSMGVSGHIAFAGAHKIKLQYIQGSTDISGGKTEEGQFSFGYDFKMAKATTVYALVNAYVEEEKAAGSTKTEKSQLVIGMVQNF